MQDAYKRRRLNGDEEHEDLAVARERMLQAAAMAGTDAQNADLQSLILRQRLLAADQFQGDVGLAGMPNSIALQQQLARYNDGSSSLYTGAGTGDLLASGSPATNDLLAARGGGASDLLATGAGAGDPMVNQLLINHRLQQAARLQAATGADDPLNSYMRASEAAAAPSSLYASLLGTRGAAAAGGLSALQTNTNSLLLEQALQQQEAGAANSLGEQLSTGVAGGRRGYMQSLLEAERDNEAAALASDPAAMRARLLGLSDPNGASSVLARLQNERAALLGAGGATGLGGVAQGRALPPSALDSLISRGAGVSGFNRDLLLSRGATGGPSQAFLGLPGAGMAPGASANKGQPAANLANPNSTGRQPIHLYMSCDDDDLSPYQCLVRKQIELFEAQEVDAETNARGRNRPIVVGQVGIRCRHCKMLPPRKRERAAIYYPSKLDRLYQAGQTMASVHLGQHCNHIPAHIRTELARLREGKSAALAGKKYWSDGARALGVIEEDERLFFRQSES